MAFDDVIQSKNKYGMMQNAKGFRFDKVDSGCSFSFRLTVFLLLVYCLPYYVGGATNAAEGQTTNTPASFTPIKWIYELSSAEALKKHLVRVQGVVTFLDPDWRMLFIQDDSCGIYVSWTGVWPKLAPGQQVEVIGTTEPGNFKPILGAKEIKPGKESNLPVPINATTADMTTGKFDSQWVEIRGRVRSVNNNSGRSQIMLVTEGKRSKVIIKNYPNQETYGLLDADVVVRGACGVATDSKRQPIGFTIFVPSRDFLIIEKPNRLNSDFIPRRNIASIPTLRRALRGDRIRLLGVVTSLETNNTGAMIQDRTGSIRVKTEEMGNLRTNMLLDVVGYLNTNGAMPFIEDATLRRMGSGSLAAMDSTNQTFQASLRGPFYPVIRQLSSLRRLKPTDAEEGFPVQIIGVITYYDINNYLMFVQDETEGIFVLLDEEVDVAPGQQVKVHGYSGPGSYAPLIRQACFQILGNAPMPIAPLCNYKQLSTGSMDSQWIEIKGIVQNQQRAANVWEMEVGITNGMTFKTTVSMPSNETLPQLTGAKVRIQGVCASDFNFKRQLIGFQVYTPSMDYISVLKSSSNPFDLPIQAITNLVQFKADKTEAELERFKGVVTATQKDGSFYMEDDTGGILVHPVKPQEIHEGDGIEVTGFAELAGLTPSLKNAEVRKTGSQALPAAVDVTEILTSTNSYESILHSLSIYDSRRIAIQGTLLNKVAGPVENVYLIQIGSVIADAHRERSKDDQDPPNLLPESTVHVTGVARFKIGRDKTPQSLEILIPSKSSLKVLHPPRGWVLARAMVVIGVLVAASLVGSIWTLTLRRKVGLQTAVIREKLEREAALETQLRQAQKMESVGQLAAGVAHDFNNILTIIQGHTSMLLGPGEVAHHQHESIQEIATAAERAAKLTKQLLAFSRKQMWQPCPLSMHELIHNLAKMLGRALGEQIQLDIQTDPSLPLVLADAGMMEQVLMNLAVNARDAMPEGGLLVIAASHIHVTPESSKPGKEDRVGHFVRIDVKDQGCGMDATVLEHLFEPFFTTKSVGKGSGLGLATAYGIVRQHQGWIDVQSQPGKGTSMQIYLPVTDKPGESLPKPKEEQSRYVGTETILLVEDEAAVRELARKILSQCGYEVVTAANGGEALGMWELQKNKPDLLFTDMVMPGGINGRQLATRLLAKQPGLKVLYASGYSQELNRDATGLHTGVNFLPKPYQVQVLVKTVRTCLDA